MNKTTTLLISALAALGIASACTVETVDSSAEDIGMGDDAACSNVEGVNATLAALAATTAKELRRWDPKTDFAFSNNKVVLTAAAKVRCGDGVCKNTQALLDWQKPEYSGKIRLTDGTWLVPDAFRTRLVSYLEAQLTCIAQPDNHNASNCPVENHDLAYVSTSPGQCASDFLFHAYKAGTTTPLQYPAQLKNRLIWAGEGRGNEYLLFSVRGDDVTIDPTGGPVEGDPAASGSCSAVCNKFSITSIAGKCCSCLGSTGTVFQLSVPVSLGGSPYMYSCVKL